MTAAESDRLRMFRDLHEHGCRALNTGNVAAAYAALPDEVEYRLSSDWPEARMLRSRDEVIAFFESFQATFPDARTSSYQYIEVDERTMIAGFHVTGSGRASGAGTEMEIWQVWRLSEELTPISVTEFGDREEALQAAHLVEPSSRRPE